MIVKVKQWALFLSVHVKKPFSSRFSDYKQEHSRVNRSAHFIPKDWESVFSICTFTFLVERTLKDLVCSS